MDFKLGYENFNENSNEDSNEDCRFKNGDLVVTKNGMGKICYYLHIKDDFTGNIMVDLQELIYFQMYEFDEDLEEVLEVVPYDQIEITKRKPF